ncbi:DMT family transporter [Peribacillus sp. TH16]|uniref:DMT family transporter n=1 Tax=Peribacillus sp. TH16 TaxID=2798482 RepID=UPI0019141EE0|nr:DMT family transporter [Peribacillus sp. TH16]MBK5482328.1 DMT family transporter [Peribacillus sp. TH16]
MNKVIFGLLVILTTALMGSSFAIGKIGLAYTSPMLLAAIRFILAGLIMAIIVKLIKRPHPSKTIDCAKLAIIGLFQTAGVMGCIFVGLRTISAGELSILTFMNPLLVIIFGTLFCKTRYAPQQWAGVFLGFIGVFITMGAHLDLKTGTLLGLMSAISWSLATLLMKNWGHAIDTWVMSAYQMLCGGLLLLIGSYLFEQPFFIITTASMLILLWLAIMASIVQFSIWFFLLQKGDSAKTSAFLFLAPFFGVLSGFILLDEPIHWYVALGGSLIFVGIFLVNWTSHQVATIEKSM